MDGILSRLFGIEWIGWFEYLYEHISTGGKDFTPFEFKYTYRLRGMSYKNIQVRF